MVNSFLPNLSALAVAMPAQDANPNQPAAESMEEIDELRALAMRLSEEGKIEADALFQLGEKLQRVVDRSDEQTFTALDQQLSDIGELQALAMTLTQQGDMQEDALLQLSQKLVGVVETFQQKTFILWSRSAALVVANNVDFIAAHPRIDFFQPCLLYEFLIQRLALNSQIEEDFDTWCTRLIDLFMNSPGAREDGSADGVAFFHIFLFVIDSPAVLEPLFELVRQTGLLARYMSCSELFLATMDSCPHLIDYFIDFDDDDQIVDADMTWFDTRRLMFDHANVPKHAFHLALLRFVLERLEPMQNEENDRITELGRLQARLAEAHGEAMEPDAYDVIVDFAQQGQTFFRQIRSLKTSNERREFLMLWLEHRARLR